jgi:DNA-binding NarL/FixJ family response regulator
MRSAISQLIGTHLPDCEIFQANRQDEALEAIGKHNPVLVITGVHLKSGNGLSLTEKSTSRYPEIAVVVFTSADAPEYRQALLDKGAVAFISKNDTSGPEFLRRIHSCLNVKISKA